MTVVVKGLLGNARCQHDLVARYVVVYLNGFSRLRTTPLN